MTLDEIINALTEAKRLIKKVDDYYSTTDELPICLEQLEALLHDLRNIKKAEQDD